MRTVLWMYTLDIYLVYFLPWMAGSLTEGKPNPDFKAVSQCYRSQGFSFVSLYCGYNKVIQIQRAFHGAHKNAAISHCGQLEGDCVSETTHYYDWSRCEGRHSCVLNIQKTLMSDCREEMHYL